MVSRGITGPGRRRPPQGHRHAAVAMAPPTGPISRSLDDNRTCPCGPSRYDGLGSTVGPRRRPVNHPRSQPIRTRPARAMHARRTEWDRGGAQRRRLTGGPGPAVEAPLASLWLPWGGGAGSGLVGLPPSWVTGYLVPPSLALSPSLSPLSLGCASAGPVVRCPGYPRHPSTPRPPTPFMVRKSRSFGKWSGVALLWSGVVWLLPRRHFLLR